MRVAEGEVAGDTGPFSERYRALFNKRGNDWWSIVFGYPLARLFLVPLVGVRLVTPNLLTLLGFACKCMAAWLLVSNQPNNIVLAAIVLQANTILDSMDGTLARARETYSRLGAFLDKVTDAIGLFAILTALGLCAAQQSGDARWIAVGAAGGAAYLVLCYMHWLAISLTRESPTPRATAGIAEVPSWRGIAWEWLAGWPRIVLFQEADLYFWVALFALLGRFEIGVALIASTQVLFIGIRIVWLGRTLSASDGVGD